MLIPLYASLGMWLVSAMSGYAVLALAGRRSVRKTSGETSVESPSNESNARNKQDVDRLIATLCDLTSNVDSQMDQHSLRLDEITNTLQAPGDVSSSKILVAGKMLASANQKLQLDLEDAKLEIQRQRQQMDSCRQESRIDALTSIPNRRALDHELVHIFADRRRNGTFFSLLILDIDHFKQVNDKYGHMVGDQLLKHVSHCLTSTVLTSTARETHFVARYGGEEFVAILRKTTIEEACEIADRIRGEILATSHFVGNLGIKISASVGVKEVQDHETEVELLQKADKALYAAKNGGRNCCYYHDGTTCQGYVPAEVTADSVQGEVIGVTLDGHKRADVERPQ